ncbi:hypothetical protein XELAEV_18004591mg [Xenopus laevis]|uniref:Uncharacterized protein n=1 Tax=Xenopus laevis TaxID=8355 RepID=A0A974BP90_XENLA|nr:hypothetical protein XELAEV_18004591mg [Xenopus laevis]
MAHGANVTLSVGLLLPNTHKPSFEFCHNTTTLQLRITSPTPLQGRSFRTLLWPGHLRALCAKENISNCMHVEARWLVILQARLVVLISNCITAEFLLLLYVCCLCFALPL